MWVITGGAGFIGSALIWELNEKGVRDLFVVDRLGQDEKWKNLRARRFADYLEADEFVDRLEKGQISKIEGIVHLGACSSTTETDAAFLIKNNFEYSRRLAVWAVKKKKRFVYASSAATYGDGRWGYRTDAATTVKLQPLNLYGYSKQLFDLWALQTGALQKITGLKFFNIYGPHEYHKGEMRSVVVKAVEQIQKEGKMKLFRSYRPEYADGEQRRDFLYVKDAVKVVVQLMHASGLRGLVNVGSGKARTWNDLAKAIFDALRKPVDIDYIEMPEVLRAKYQYHTEAEMGWRSRIKGAKPFLCLEEGVKDYVQNYLMKEDPYL